MGNRHVLFISAGMLRPKKTDHPLARLHLYLNYGLLGLASSLNDKGYDVRLTHGQFIPPSEVVRSLTRRGWLNTEFPIFLSIPSSYAIAWSKEFCRLVKEEVHDLKIVVGGRWVIGTDGPWIKSLIPEIDLVVYGTAERRVEDLLYQDRWSSLSFVSSSSTSVPEAFINNLPDLNYQILDNCDSYQPSIEVSRGCGMGCSFCAEKDVALTQIESPNRIISKIIKCQEQYNSVDIRPYFEASYFRPSHKWATEFATLYRRHDLDIKWRCESRVDALSPGTLEALAGAGLKIIDLGLESASSRQLRAMNKTTSPGTYLKRASTFLNECRKVGVWVKVNILMYPGEGLDSLGETREWLSTHAECIKGLSVGPLVIYRFDKSRKYLDSLTALGAALVGGDSLDKEGFANLHLSRAIDHETAEHLSTEICQDFMTDEDYFDLKGFSYLPRGYSFKQFQEVLSLVNHSTLPFKISLPFTTVLPKQ